MNEDCYYEHPSEIMKLNIENLQVILSIYYLFDKLMYSNFIHFPIEDDKYFNEIQFPNSSDNDINKSNLCNCIKLMKVFGKVAKQFESNSRI